MAKKKKKGKIARELDTINVSLDSIMEQYPSLTPKERKSKLKKLKAEQKAHEKKQAKSGVKNIVKTAMLKSKIKKVSDTSGRLPINYGGVPLKIKTTYLKSIKDKEKYLDGLFNRRMSAWLRNFPVPKNEHQAQELEGLITKYSKKLKFSKYYDPNIVENNINKLTNFRNNVLSSYDYSDFIGTKKDIIYNEIDDYESGKEIDDYYEEETGESEEIYKAIEKPVLIDDLLIGLEFNFF